MISGLFIALIVLVVIYILAPLLFYHQTKISIVSEDEKERLLVEKGEIYNFLKDLEYDYKEGKISENDYRTAKDQLLQQAAGILKKLENHSG